MSPENQGGSSGGETGPGETTTLLDNALAGEHGPAADLAGSAGDLWGRMSEGDWDATAMIADGQAATAAMLAVLDDPLGALVQAGVGFVIDHVSFLREPLEVLTGAPDQIMALAQRFVDMQGNIDQASGEFQQALGSVPTWEGPTADAYRQLGDSAVEGLHATSAVAAKVSEGIQAAARMVAQVKETIFTMISDFVQRAIQKALAALAASWATFGGSVAAATAAIAADAAQMAQKFCQRLSKLLDAAEKFNDIFQTLQQGVGGLGEAMEKIAALSSQAGGDGPSGDTADAGGEPAPVAA